MIGSPESGARRQSTCESLTQIGVIDVQEQAGEGVKMLTGIWLPENAWAVRDTSGAMPHCESAL